MPNAKLIAAKDLPEAVRSAISAAEKRASLTAQTKIESWTIIGRRIDDLTSAKKFAEATVAELGAAKHVGIEPIVVALPGGGHTAGFFPVDKLMKPQA